MSNLPAYVKECDFCNEDGEHKTMFTAGCGGGYYYGYEKCPLCNGGKYLYKHSSKAVPKSVINQIKVAEENN